MFLGKQLRFNPHARPSAAMLGMVGLIVITFLFGGSARGDEWALIIYRPVSVVMLMFGVYHLKLRHVVQAKFVLLWLALIMLFVVISLIPLPPNVWQTLPGREVVAEVDRYSGVHSAWRPLSLSPELTRNAFWSLLGPAAAVLFAVQLSKKELMVVFRAIFLMSLISGFLSVVQITQGPSSPFYLYRVTNYGEGVGFFANRNHQAILLSCQVFVSFLILIPVSARLSSKFKLNHLGVAAGLLSANSAFLILLIVITGSRSGAILGLVALVFGYFVAMPDLLHKNLQSNHKLNWRRSRWPVVRPQMVMPIVFAMVVAAVLAATFSGRNVALNRMEGASLGEEGRVAIFGPLVELVKLYFPWGSGIGTFDPVFRVHEPYHVLAPTYWNHAHNDWLEVLMTTGVFGLASISAIIYWLVRLYGDKSKNNRDYLGPDGQKLKNIGAGYLIIIAISSFVEYPLRVPVISCIMGVAIVSISTAFRAGNIQR